MILEKQIDELTKEQFRFWTNGNLIILDSYYFLRRENKRKRNYEAVKRYERLTSRNRNISIEEVPFTEQIKQEALQEYIKTLKVMTWNEYKGK